MKNDFTKTVHLKTIAAVMLCAILPIAAWAEDKSQPQQEKLSTDSILVEACLVEVSNASLAAAGTAALPDAGEKSVSITKLLWCMKDPNVGKAVSMARAFCRTRYTAKSGTTTTMYVPQTTTQIPTTGGPIHSTSYMSYDSKSEIEVSPSINEDNSLSLWLKFTYSGFIKSKVDEQGQAPPGKLAYNFESPLVVKPNQPMIVGGMQNGDSSLFLVIRAEIVK